jgi:flagellar biosynthetic protein FliP
MGFVLFLPFIAIDLVISSILISMGMFTLPPIVVSTPLKILLFILVDGWNLVVGSLAQSFATS